MKIKQKKTESKNWGLPGEPLIGQEFQKGIKNAEKGSFYTIEESKKMIAKWREQRNSK